MHVRFLAPGGKAVIRERSGTPLATSRAHFHVESTFGALQGASVCQAEKFPLEADLNSVKSFMPFVNRWALDLMEPIKDGRLAGDQTTFATVNTHCATLRYLVELCKEHGINRAMPDALRAALSSS